jgi:hypothetical protein
MRGFVFIVVAGLSTAAVAQVCTQQREIDKYQLLRRLSLDLRGRIPDVAEYEALESQATVPDSVVASYLASDDFRRVMRRYHEDLFWPNLSAVALNAVGSALVLNPNSTEIWSIVSAARRRLYRGVAEVDTSLGSQCGDFEQTKFLPGGGFRPDPTSIRTSVVNGVTVRQEGWRLVTPYWSATPLKVCAYDAQETETVTIGTGSAARTLSCGSYEANGNTDCGCGAGLKYCFGPAGVVRNQVYAAMREQLALMVDRVSTGGQPYTELVTSRSAPTNGVLNFWRKNLAPNTTRVWTFPDPGEALGNPVFTDTTWTINDRGSNLHSGVLTTPAYMLRFQTNRARGNRYRIDFECESFSPPANLETPADGCSADSDDLTKRCTCRGCHRILEPLASHWGQFAESGTHLMSDTAAWPRMRSNCVNNRSTICTQFYVTNDDAPNPGALLPYQFADAAHPDITSALAGGPRKRVNESIANGSFARCAVKRAFGTLMKREPLPDEATLVMSLADDFKTNNYSLPWLMQRLVAQPQYRRVR